MKNKRRFALYIGLLFCVSTFAQHIRVSRIPGEKRIEIFIDNHLFTQFLFPDSLEKPVLYPIYAGNHLVTRGFPLNPRPGEPTDHPHHLGLWLNFENVNGLDFWNNSYAIPVEKKSRYGWIRTDSLLETVNGDTGSLSYHANWVNQKNKVLLEETTHFEFSGSGTNRFISRVTELKADTDVVFTDAKDGLLGLRLARELQIPAAADQSFTDQNGNITVVKKDSVAGGNYLTSAGKSGDAAWSTRGAWCSVFGKIGNDSVRITIFDDPDNPNYPTFWHARGYGLFAANPLGEKIFTNGKSQLNLSLKKGESVRFHFGILIEYAHLAPIESLNKTMKLPKNN